jgi:hypothetical protein
MTDLTVTDFSSRNCQIKFKLSVMNLSITGMSDLLENFPNFR